MSDNPFRSVDFIVPVSGIDFIKYISFFTVLEGIKPRTIVCASGGCMVSYIAMMSSFTTSIRNWKINSEMFMHKKVGYIPRLLNLLLFGALYDRTDITSFAREHFVASKLKGRRNHHGLL